MSGINGLRGSRLVLLLSVLGVAVALGGCATGDAEPAPAATGRRQLCVGRDRLEPGDQSGHDHEPGQLRRNHRSKGRG